MANYVRCGANEAYCSRQLQQLRTAISDVMKSSTVNQKDTRQCIDQLKLVPRFCMQQQGV
jgi:hypothetical protein